MSIASLYPSINPSLLLDFANVKRLDPRITFTRTTTATYYDGVTTAKAEENLLLQSQAFDNAAWTKTNTTVTANATTAPDGTSTAEALFETAVTNEFRVNQSCSATSGLNYTISVYVKANGRNYVALYDAQNSQGKYFDVTAGGGGSVQGNFVGAPVSASISYVGSDWYRCSMTVSNTSSSIAVRIYIANTATNVNYAGDVTKGLYLWGAQVEQRSSATAYTATTSQAITNYIPVLQTASSGQARFDHNPTTGESLGLLIEEARTNACPYSEAIGSWSAVNATAQSNVAIAPSGALTADKILPDATASVAHGWYNTITAAASTTYTASIFAKAAEYSWLYLTEGNNVTATAFFNLSTGALGTVSGTGSPSATITSVGNGWYRCSLTFTTAVGATVANIQARVTTADNTNSFTASSGTVGYSGIFVWGGQFETGSFATSYIPNLTTGSTTRNADAASMTGTNFSSWFNGGAGTVFTESLPISATGSSRVCAFSDGSSSNRILIIASTGNHLYVDALGSNVADLDGGTYSSSVFNKQGSGYAVNDYAVTINGGAIASDSSGATPVGINVLYIGADSNGTSNILNGRIRKLAYYPIRVTNTQLQSLTV